MRVILRNLSVLAYANGFTLWHYRAGSETRAEVSETGYFDPASDMLRSGDIMMVSAADGVRMLAVAHGGGQGSGVMLAPLG